jgi:hypothetical protein
MFTFNTVDPLWCVQYATQRGQVVQQLALGQRVKW